MTRAAPFGPSRPGGDTSITVAVSGTPESLVAALWAGQESLRRHCRLRIVGIDPHPGLAVAACSPWGYPPTFMLETAADAAANAARAVRTRYPQVSISARAVQSDLIPALTGPSAQTEMFVLGSRLTPPSRFRRAHSEIAAIATRSAVPVMVVQTPDQRLHTSPPGDADTDTPADDAAGTATTVLADSRSAISEALNYLDREDCIDAYPLRSSARVDVVLMLTGVQDSAQKWATEQWLFDELSRRRQIRPERHLTGAVTSATDLDERALHLLTASRLIVQSRPWLSRRWNLLRTVAPQRHSSRLVTVLPALAERAATR